MAYVPYGLTTADEIIKAAARQMNDRAVETGQCDPRRLQMYYDALNDFIQSVGMSRHWLWLMRESAFATEDGTASYDMRLAASATVTITGAPTAAQAVTVDGTAYAFTSASTTAALAIAELISLINAGTQCYALQTSSSTVELYWSGDDGYAKTVTENVSNLTVDATFSYSMEDFGRLVSARTYSRRPLSRVNPIEVHERAYNSSDGEPVGYAMTGGHSTMRLYSGTRGNPDDIYLVQVRYQSLMSAVLPDGRGQIDIPLQYRGILPRAIKMVMNMDAYDQEAVFGDQYVQKWLRELESYDPDSSDINVDTEPYDLPQNIIVLE